MFPPAGTAGQEPDFSYVQISPAGAVNRPDVTASVRDIENLSLEMVRVLDDDHRAVGPGIRTWKPPSCRWPCATCCSHVCSTTACRRSQRQGRISFYIKSTGEEAIAVAQGMALQTALRGWARKRRASAAMVGARGHGAGAVLWESRSAGAARYGWDTPIRTRSNGEYFLGRDRPALAAALKRVMEAG